MNRMMVLLAAMLMVVGFSGMAHASLSVVGEGTINGGTTDYQLIYDSAQNITWFDYTAPRTTWQNQENWALGLTVNVSGQNITGWSLPTTVDNAASSNYPPNPTSSQMAYLYYTDLGNTTSSGLANTGPFKNLKANVYWSGTEYSGDPGNAWYFFADYGIQGVNVEGNYYDGLAVLPGNIATEYGTPTPIPGTVLLFGSGLAGLVGIKRRLG